MDRRNLRIEFIRGSGPGGQHRNKTETGVRLTHVPTGIVVVATERRSRPQNLQAARERLAAKLREHRRRPKPRIKTRRTRASVQRRLTEKARRGKVKRLRRRPADD